MSKPVDMQPLNEFQNPAMGKQQFSNMPPSMQYLESLSSVNIHQVLHLIEVLTGWEKKNQYELCNTQNQKIFHAQEESECCERQFCGSIRSFTMPISDLQGTVVILLKRPLKCQGCCCPCCLQEMEIECPPGNHVATIHEMWSCWRPRYEVCDPSGAVMYKIEGQCCYCKCGCDVQFRVTRSNNEAVGEIVKHWGGCREMIGQVNDFSVNFPQNEPIQNKAILLGSTFLVDMMYFEVKNN